MKETKKQMMDSLNELFKDVNELQEDKLDNDLAFTSIYDTLSMLSDEVALNRLQSMYHCWGLIILDKDELHFMFPYETPNTDLSREDVAKLGYIYHSTIGNREFWYLPNA